MDCFKCHGKNYSKPLRCGHTYCPIFSKLPEFKTKKIEKDNFVGTSPSVFVGRYGYPNINVGLLALPDKVVEESSLYDAPKEWASRNFQVNDILDFRSILINTKFQNSVKSQGKYLDLVKEVSMSIKPVDIEYLLHKKPVYQVKVSDVETVIGAKAQLKKAVATENIKVDSRVENIVEDKDLRAVEGLNSLYNKGFDENFLTRVFSMGNFGIEKNRRLVPTRWSITSVDDIIGKRLIEEVKDFKEVNYQMFFGNYLGNYFLILFFPRVWSYELFEMYLPSTLLNSSDEIKFTTDHEFYDGRKTYAENCVGGYYASRLSVLEKFKSLKKQGAVVVLRFITEEYTTPLGVFVVREAVRKSLVNSISFSSEKEMLDYSHKLIFNKFKFDINCILKQSKIYSLIKTQKKLFDF